MIRNCLETQFHNVNKPVLLTSPTIGSLLELLQTCQLKLFCSEFLCLTNYPFKFDILQYFNSIHILTLHTLTEKAQKNSITVYHSLLQYTQPSVHFYNSLKSNLVHSIWFQSDPFLPFKRNGIKLVFY